MRQPSPGVNNQAQDLPPDRQPAAGDFGYTQ